MQGIEFERMAKADEVGCQRGKTFLWTGYGCTRWGGRIDGKFRTGDVNAISCPAGRNYDTVTRGNVALCSGDSGGGGYVASADGSRLLVGVNSRSDTRVTSYVSSTYVSTFYEFADWYQRNYDVEICGLNDQAENCRGADKPDPDPDPDPKPDCSEERKTLAMAMELTVEAHSELEACLER